MNEEPYQNREIDEMIRDIKETLARIEIQTTKTNGRVNELEKWRWMILGAFSLFSMILLPIAFIFIKEILQ